MLHIQKSILRPKGPLYIMEDIATLSLFRNINKNNKGTTMWSLPQNVEHRLKNALYSNICGEDES